MVEAGRVPVLRGMALRAVRGRQHVTGPLARSRPPVVARGACPAHGSMIERGVRPARRRMAVLASGRRGDVVRRLARRQHAIVTGRARLRGPLENAIPVATAAIDRAVPVRQGKARLQVDRGLISRPWGWCSCSGERDDAQSDRHCDEHPRTRNRSCPFHAATSQSRARRPCIGPPAKSPQHVMAPLPCTPPSRNGMKITMGLWSKQSTN